jgi:hypothetical protein
LDKLLYTNIVIFQRVADRINMIQEKIYEYFERNPWLKVLFLFNDEFIAMQLVNLKWRNDYRYVNFKDDRFTAKYRLDNIKVEHEFVRQCFTNSKRL